MAMRGYERHELGWAQTPFLACSQAGLDIDAPNVFERSAVALELWILAKTPGADLIVSPSPATAHRASMA
jgi:hypothetical protein